MRIINTEPDEVINVFHYDRELKDGDYHNLDYVRSQVGQTLCTRLVVNRYGDRDDDFAGDFTLEVADIVTPQKLRNAQAGIMRITLALPESAQPDKKVKPEEYYLTPMGILLPTNRLKWALFGGEVGYFPENKTNWDDALNGLTAKSPTADPPVLAH